jgi:hypothetical protein
MEGAMKNKLISILLFILWVFVVIYGVFVALPVLLIGTGVLFVLGCVDWFFRKLRGQE